jgi:aldehyde dehydrogenase (NAD+)
VQSGSVVVNDVLVHLAVSGLPFGGVGSSGMGAYHGKHSFNAFSSKRSVLKRDGSRVMDLYVRYAPYTSDKWKLFEIGKFELEY